MYRSKQCFSVSQSINQSANQHTNNVTPGLKKFHRLPIQYKIKFKICLMMHSVSVNHCPTYISQLVQPVSSSSRRQGVRSSSSAKYVVQRTRTKFAERAFSVADPSVWNSLYLQISDSSLKLLFLNANLKVTCFVLFLLSNFLRRFYRDYCNTLLYFLY